MAVLMVRDRKVELELLDASVVTHEDDRSIRLESGDEGADLVNAAARAFFAMEVGRGARSAEVEDDVAPAVFREAETGLLRLAHREVVLRFRPGTSEEMQRKILGYHGFEVRRRNAFIEEQVVAAYPERHGDYMGARLVELANSWSEMAEVVGASPNFVSQFRRDTIPQRHPRQWHLDAIDAPGAWSRTTGDRGIRVAVLDDGVDVEHPNLASNMVRDPDPGEVRDVVGRDYFIPDRDAGEHFNPRPKIFRYPFDKTAGNDNHGTPCAGLVVAAGVDGGAVGVAPRCQVLAVKIFHADSLAPDSAVADAIRYSATHADILSCSWSGGAGSLDVELAIEDAGSLGRGGLGSAVFCAAGNGWGRPVAFPARHPDAIAIGAVGRNGVLAPYSNVGDELWVVAPSSAGPDSGLPGIFTTDVSYDERGYNPRPNGDPAGLHTADFGGTSAATPIAAGVGALVLSVHPQASRSELKEILRASARAAGPAAPGSHHMGYGYGMVDAAAAVAEAERRAGIP